MFWTHKKRWNSFSFLRLFHFNFFILYWWTLKLRYYFTFPYDNKFGMRIEDEKIILRGRHYQLICLYPLDYLFYKVGNLLYTHLKNFLKFTVTFLTSCEFTPNNFDQFHYIKWSRSLRKVFILHKYVLTYAINKTS